MPANNSSTISPLVAAQLSQAAYSSLSNWTEDPTGASFGVSLPTGWVAVPNLSTNEGSSEKPDTTVQEIAFANASTGQLVFAFRGSDNLSNFTSDLINSGGAAWESMSPAFANIMENLPNSAYSGYSALVDGHSLGGGMAQTAALEYGLSGYTQNALPISQTAINNDFEASSFSDAVSQWTAAGNFVNATNVSGDPATLYYNTLQGQTYLAKQDDNDKKKWVFTSQVELPIDSILVEGRQIRLTPSMNITAEIKTGRRRIISYLLSPLIQHAEESLHER